MRREMRHESKAEKRENAGRDSVLNKRRTESFEQNRRYGQILTGAFAQRECADICRTDIQRKHGRFRRKRAARTIDKGECRLLSDLTQERRGAAAHAQQAGVRRKRVAVVERLGNLQQHAGEQARKPRMGIAFGFYGFKQLRAGRAALRLSLIHI